MFFLHSTQIEAMKYIIFTFLSMFWFSIPTLYAQIPTGVPGPEDNSPIDLTDVADILIYIVLPVIIILLVVMRHKNKKK